MEARSRQFGSGEQSEMAAASQQETPSDVSVSLFF